MKNNDNPIDNIVACLFVMLIATVIAVLIVGICSLVSGHEIQSTDDKVTAKQGTYFVTEYNGKVIIVTAGHVVEKIDGPGIMSFVQIERNMKLYPVEVILYDNAYDIAILEAPKGFCAEVELSDQYYPPETDVTIIGNVCGIQDDVYFDATIAGPEVGIEGCWEYVVALSAQSGAGSSGSQVCLKNTNICVGVLVGGIPDRDLTLMVPSVRVLELLKGWNN